jgi:hypothetical protein
VVQVVMSGLRGVSRILPWPVNPKDLLDMYSWPISSCRTAYKQFCIFCARLNSDWRSRWGFWHVGQVGCQAQCPARHTCCKCAAILCTCCPQCHMPRIVHSLVMDLVVLP